MALELDVTSPASARVAVAAYEAHFGGLDTFVNSAGIIYFTPLAAISEAEWDRVIDVDLKGQFVCAQAAAPLLRHELSRTVILFTIMAEITLQ